MYEEGFENFQSKPEPSFKNQRKFGTVLTQAMVDQRAYSQNPKKPAKSFDTEDLYTEIYRNLMDIESYKILKSDYMLSQKDITPNMRAILIDWLILIQLKMKLSAETLYLTVNIIDRFLEKNQVSRKELQLVGICAMLIACKYEESIVPNIKDLVFITADAYTIAQVLSMEIRMLTELNFDFTIVSLLMFIERYSELLRFTQREYYLARYFSELSLLDHNFSRFKPSVLGSACVYLANKYRDVNSNAFLKPFMPYFYSELKECVLDLVRLVNKYKKCSLQAIRSKYSLEAFLEISSIADSPYLLEENILNEIEYY